MTSDSWKTEKQMPDVTMSLCLFSMSTCIKGLSTKRHDVSVRVNRAAFGSDLARAVCAYDPTNPLCTESGGDGATTTTTLAPETTDRPVIVVVVVVIMVVVAVVVVYFLIQ